jgi:hypothetical protein
MRYGVIIITLTVLAFLGKSVFGYSLVLPFVIAFSFKMTAEESFLNAFIAGVILSLIHGSVLGLESLGLLLASGLIHLYQRRLSRKHWLFYLLFAGLGSVLYSLIVGRYLTGSVILLDVILIFLMLQFIFRLKEKFFSDSIILKV